MHLVSGGETNIANNILLSSKSGWFAVESMSRYRNGGREGHQMAELSDFDKKVLFGENYKEVERLAELANNKTAQQRLAESLRGHYEQVRNYALVIAGIATIIVVTNYLQISGPYQSVLGIGTAIAVVGGVICASFAQMGMRKHS
jgi:hypothetical protein